MADAGGPEGPPLRSSAAAFAKATASREGPPLRSSADGPSPGSIAEGSPLRRSADVSTGSPIESDPEFEAWHRRWEVRRGRQPQSRADGDSLMRQHNPAIIPRNHNVEAALTAAAGGDFSVMERLLDVLATPYDHERDLPMFSAPDSGGRRYRTFCGT